MSFFKPFKYSTGWSKDRDYLRKLDEFTASYRVGEGDFLILESSLRRTEELSSRPQGLPREFLDLVTFILFSATESFLLSKKEIKSFEKARDVANYFCYKISLPLENEKTDYFSVTRSISSGREAIDEKIAKLLVYAGNDEYVPMMAFSPPFGLFSRLAPHFFLDGGYLYDEFGFGLCLAHEVAHLHYAFSNAQRLKFKGLIDDLVKGTADSFELPFDHKYIGELYAYLYGYLYCQSFGGDNAAKEYLNYGKKRVDIFLKRVSVKEDTAKNIFFHAKFYPDSLKPHIFARLLAPLVIRDYPNDWVKKLLSARSKI